MKQLLIIPLALLLFCSCSFKINQESADIIFRITARNITYELLTYAPDLQRPLKLFLQAFQLALENNQKEAISLLEKEALSYLEVRFSHKPALIQDIKDLYLLIQLEADFTPYQKYSSVIDGALSAIYLFEEY